MATLLPIWAATGTVTPPDASKISVGWLLGEKPPHEHMNWWQQEMVHRINHVLTQGVPEWDATTPYPVNAATKRNGLVYRATVANQNSQPPSANWLQVSQNASALTSGVVPNAQISGSYTNFVNITASGVITAGNSLVTGGVIAHSSGDLSLRTGTSGTNRLTVTDAGITVAGTATATTFVGSASGLTNIPAGQLTGTISNDRLSGSYSFANLTLTGVLTAATVTSSPGTGTNNGFNFGNPDSARIQTIAAGNDIRLVIGGSSRLIVSETAVSAAGSAVFTGNGSGLTTLNASNLASGIVPNARISGAYTGFTNITASGTITAAIFNGTGGSTFQGNSADTAALPSFTWTGDLNTGIWRPAADQIGIATGGASRLTITNTAVSVAGSAVFTGNGSGLTALNASNLASGTVNDSRLPTSMSGKSFTSSVSITGGLTTTTSANFGSSIVTGGVIAHSSGNLALRTGTASTNRLTITDAGITVSGTVTATTFSGNGSGLNTLNASELDSGTVPTARLGTAAADNSWVGARYAAVAWNAIGSTSWVGRNSNVTITNNETVSGSPWEFMSFARNDSRLNWGTNGTAIPGVWRALTSTGGNDGRSAVMAKRIS